MTRSSQVRLTVCALLCAAASVTTPIRAGQAPSSGRQAWSGTVTVTRNASGSMKSDDGKAALGFTGSETITFTLGPDGTATYHATFRHNLDYSGEYAVPSAGSGSGSTYYGVGFNGVNWEVVIDGGDTFPVQTDHTAEDLWWAYQFREFIKLGEAIEGKKAPPYGGRLEKGGRGANGVAFVSTGGANAKTLSGTHVERLPSSGPEGLEGLPMIPMTLTVSWNLTLGPVQPKVAIRGPDCGCLDAEDPSSAPLTFRAGATVGGGEFSEFELVAEGKAPEVVSNDGGEHPQLVLSGTRETGPVTLKIHYTKDGRRYDAAPVRVEFCTLEEIKLEDDERDLAFDGNGQLVVRAHTKAWHNGDEVSGEVAWDLDKMAAPTALSAEPANAKAEKIKFTYDGLPDRNDSFGPKRVTASVTRGKCSCHQADSIRAFFDPDDNAHPGDDSPNWFYYWSQTGAVAGEARSHLRYQETIVDPNLPDARPIAKYDPASQRLLVSRALHVQHGCRGAVDSATRTATGQRNEGIDCFAETVRHEWQHRTDAIVWWGSPAGPFGISLVDWFARDWDHDQVPNDVEDREPGCRYGSLPALTPAGGRETWFTCARRPFPDATDAEITAYYTGWTWPTGSMNKADWSCGPLGKQWRGRSCQ